MSMGRHRDALDGSGPRFYMPRGVLALIIIGCIVAAVITAYVKLSEPSCSGSPITVTVVADDDIAPSMSTVVANWNRSDPAIGGRCVLAEVDSKSSSATAAALEREWKEKTDGTRPDVWVPAAKAWLQVAKRSPTAVKAIPSGSKPLVSTPLVLAMPHPMVVAAKMSERFQAWPKLATLLPRGKNWSAYGHKEWGPIRLGMGDPGQDTAALLAASAAGGADSATVTSSKVNTAAVTALRRALSRAPATTTDLLTGLGTAPESADYTYLSAMPITERDLIRYDTTGPRVTWDALYPSEGSAIADHPYVVLSASWVDRTRREAAEKFEKFARSSASQQVFRFDGFRSADLATAPEALPSSNNFQRKLSAPVHAPGTPTGLGTVIDTSRAAAKKPRK